jgi:ferredoxin
MRPRLRKGMMAPDSGEERMEREIVRIDEEKCNGCGECLPSCHEGAIRLEGGKARLVDERMCDGLGACLGACPQGAITIERRDAAGFGETDAAARRAAGPDRVAEPGAGCPGARARVMERRPAAAHAGPPAASSAAPALASWPIQLHLLGPMAPFLRGADVLLCADCVGYALGGLPGRLADGRVLAIACPKLDEGQEIYLDKLVAMIDHAGIRSLSVARMEVPCCRGLVALALEAARRAERRVPVTETVVGIEGDIISDGKA